LLSEDGNVENVNVKNEKSNHFFWIFQLSDRDSNKNFTIWKFSYKIRTKSNLPLNPYDFQFDNDIGNAENDDFNLWNFYLNPCHSA
jgi:hypothetical protein